MKGVSVEYPMYLQQESPPFGGLGGRNREDLQD